MSKNTGRVAASLAGKTALVTGAGKRLGRAVALRLAEEGGGRCCALQFVGGRSAGRLRRDRSIGASRCGAASEFERRQRNPAAVCRSGETVWAAGRASEQRREFSAGENIVLMTEEIWDASLDTNLKAGFFCTQAAAPLLRRTHGTIVNFADAGGLMGWPGYIPHSISKAGVVMLTKVLAKALAPEVRVNAIAPGTISMPGDPPEWEADFVKIAPLQRTGRPSDIADAVSYLVHAEFLTGHTLVLDGGRSLGPAKEEFR